MSNLNVNNIDVQRIINVLNELSSKIQICSFLTFKTMYNIEQNKEYLMKKVNNLEFFEDLDNHFQCMMEFRSHVIELEEEKKESEKNSESKDEDRMDESDENQSQAKEMEKRERQDLLGITEGFSDETKSLSKSTRNLCRKYYKEISILQELEMFRMDPEIIKLSKDFNEVLMNSYIKKTKMTKEEELSQISLNVHLTSKIIDLQHQIDNKTFKLDNLKRERLNFKTNCNNQLNDIDGEITNLREKTKNELDRDRDNINKELNNEYDQHEKEVNELKSKLKEVTHEFEERKKKHEDTVEKDAIKNYDKEAGDLKSNINEYDVIMKDHREFMNNLKQDSKLEENKLNSLNIEREKSKTMAQNYQESFKKQEERLTALKYESDMKNYASDYIQSQFKGFFARKALKKKFGKILAPLKLAPLPPPDQKDKGKGGKPKK